MAIIERGNVHDPILQLKTEWGTHTCPWHRPMKARAESYQTGVVDTPPIAVQVEDNQKGIVRRWQAARCFCPDCQKHWDVIQVNEIINP